MPAGIPMSANLKQSHHEPYSAFMHALCHLKPSVDSCAAMTRDGTASLCWVVCSDLRHETDALPVRAKWNHQRLQGVHLWCHPQLPESKSRELSVHAMKAAWLRILLPRLFKCVCPDVALQTIPHMRLVIVAAGLCSARQSYGTQEV